MRMFLATGFGRGGGGGDEGPRGYAAVKRMFSATGHEVLTLHRLSFGPLRLDPALAEGQWRELRPEELDLLKAAAGMEAERTAEES